MSAPEWGTSAHDWWAKGANAEAEARNEGLAPEQQGVRVILESMFRQGRSIEDALASLLWIYGGRRWNRLRLAWRVVARR